MEDQWLEGIIIKGYTFVIPFILSWKEDGDLVMEETVVKIWNMRSYSSDFARKWSHPIFQLLVLYVISELFLAAATLFKEI